MFLDLAPDKGPVEQHVGAVRWVHRWTVRPQRFLRIQHKWQRLIDNAHLFSGVFRKRAALSHHGDDPLAGVTRLPHRQWMAFDLRRIEPVHQRIGRSGEFIAGQDIMHARHRQCF